jgi:hypothetical protein
MRGKSEEPAETRERKPVLNPIKLTTDQIHHVSDLLLTIPFATLIAGNLLPSNDPKIVFSAPEPAAEPVQPVPVKAAESAKAPKPSAKAAAKPSAKASPKQMGKAAAKPGGKGAAKPPAKPPAASEAKNLESWLDGLLS